MTAVPSSNFDDEIDLRALVLTLWKARLAILITTLVAVVSALVVSFWVLPRQYQATAYIYIGKPAIDVAQTDGITVSPVVPDLNAVAKLATARELLESALEDPMVAAAMGDEKVSIADFGLATVVGKDELSLQVTDTDPQRAALLANTWAAKVTDAVNATYGVGSAAQILDAQVLQSQQDYEQAQTALEEALSTSQADALNAQLERERQDLADVLDSITRTTQALNDLQFFEQGLSGLPGETPLALGDGLALTTLRQSALTVASGEYTVQIDSASFVGFTVSDALDTAAQMRAGLQSQLRRLQSDQSRLEGELPQLGRDLENANAQLAQFTLQRDQSQALYADLLQEQQRVVTVLAQSGKVASLSIGAVPPGRKSSPKTLMNTALAGIIGLMLSAGGALALNWWKNT